MGQSKTFINSHVPALAAPRSPEGLHAEDAYNAAVAHGEPVAEDALRAMVMAHLVAYPRGINHAHPRD